MFTLISETSGRMSTFGMDALEMHHYSVEMDNDELRRRLRKIKAKLRRNIIQARELHHLRDLKVLIRRIIRINKDAAETYTNETAIAVFDLFLKQLTMLSSFADDLDAAMPRDGETAILPITPPKTPLP